MWQNDYQRPPLYPPYPPPSFPHPHQTRPHLLQTPPYHQHPLIHPNSFPPPTYWPFYHQPSYPEQPSHLPNTNPKNNPTGTKSTDHRLAKQKLDHKIRMKHLIRMLSLAPPPPPCAAPASTGQPGRRSRGGRRPPGPGCGRGRGSVLNSRLGRVYGQQEAFGEKCGEEITRRNAEQTDTRTEETVGNSTDNCREGQMTDDHSTNIPPSSGSSHSLLNINLPPPNSCFQPPASELPSPSSFPLPPPGSNHPTLNGCPPSSSHPPFSNIYPPPNSIHPPPRSSYPPPSSILPPPNSILPPPNSSFPPPNSIHPPPNSIHPPPNSSFPPQNSIHPPDSCTTSLVPPGSCLPPPASSSLASGIPPPPENCSLYQRRPTPSVRTCDWKPARTVDYEGMWAPGVVTEYREKMADKEVFKPETFDYGHGGGEGREVKGEKSVDNCEGNVTEESETSSERKGYSRKRLVGFF